MFGLSTLTSVLGKLFSIIIVVIATQYHVLAGIVVLLIVIFMNHHVIEGMTNNDATTDDDDVSNKEDASTGNMSDDNNQASEVEVSKSSDTITQPMNGNKLDKKPTYDEIVSKFKTDHCKNGKLMLNDTEVSSELIGTSFPDLKFKGDMCNPCDDDCEFEIVSSNEKLTVEENLRAKDSNTEPVDRETVIKKQP